MQGGGTKKDWVSEEVYEQFRDAAKELRDAIDDVEQRMQFDAAAARPAAETALQLLGLAADGVAAALRPARSGNWACWISTTC